MSTFDYKAAAELFAAKGRSGLRYPGPPKRSGTLSKSSFSGTSLEVNDERYNATQIRALSESGRSPLQRSPTMPSCQKSGYMG
jgi:hypothetical protein